jgi:ATP-dependent DNA helicase RecG
MDRAGAEKREGWPDWREAILAAHRGEDGKARDRLAYDELLANSLALMLVRASNRRAAGQALRGDGHLRSRLSLPFALTGRRNAPLPRSRAI